MIELILEGALAVLLAACLFFCWRLERKLAKLRTGGDGIREAARELNESVLAAEKAIRALRQTAQDSGRDLQARIDAASGVADRLGLAVGRVRSGADLGRGGR